MSSRIFLHGWKNSPLQQWEESGALKDLPIFEQGLKVAVAGMETDFKSNGLLTVKQRKEAQASFLPFVQSTFPKFFVGWHHRLLAQKLEDVYHGRIKRLMVNMPPRHGKSELVSRRFPAWVLGKNPNEEVVACSYSADLASRMNRDVQRIMMLPEYNEIFPRTRLNEKNVVSTAQGAALKNSRIFEVVGNKGVYVSAGVCGPITGKGMTLGIVDDPVKNREEAESKRYRDKLWDWWSSTFITRGEGAASLGGEERIIVTLTRWHDDDLGGRIIKHAEMVGEEWEILSLPAILDTAPYEYDPREMGDALWPEKFSVKKLEGRKKSIIPRDWESMYQQRTAPAEGGMFHRDWWQWYEEEPTMLDQMLMSWDMAFKDSTTSSYVVGQVWGVKGPNRYLLDQYREHTNFLGTLNAFQKMLMRWDKCTAKLIEDKANGPAIISVLQTKVQGVIAINPRGSKLLRAEAVTPFVQAGNIFLPKNKSFSYDLVEEAASFPISVFDDQVDAMSQALTYLHKDKLKEFEDLCS